MRSIALPVHNPYQATPLIQLLDESERFLLDSYAWGRWESIEFPETDQDGHYRVASTDLGRLDNLAQKYYRNRYLWWVIAHVNDIVDPIFGMTVGQVLRIPAWGTVFAALSVRDTASAASVPAPTFGLPIGVAGNSTLSGG
jgi:hypothetical protein